VARLLALALLLPCLFIARGWTVMVYMAADNDLVAWADSDIVEMRAANIADDDVAVIVQLDRPGTGAQYLQIAGDVYNLGNLGIIDMCDPRTLSDFIEWTVREFPSDRYILILWDHGTGWTAAPRRSFGSDFSSGTRMSIANGDLRKALQDSYEATGKKLNIIAFDACLMQQAEVAYEAKDYAKVMVAAQTNWPIAGFPYDILLQEISDHAGDDEKTVAAAIVDLCAHYYGTTYSASISAIALEYIDDLEETTAALFKTCKYGRPAGNMDAVRDAVQTIPFIGSTPSPDDDIIDYGDLLNRLKDAAFCQEQIIDLLEVYAKSILRSKSWGTQYAGVSGLDIWFPLYYEQFKQLSPYYRPLTWNRSRWQSFLNWFYDQDDVRPEPTSITGIQVTGNNYRSYWHDSYDLADVTYTALLMTDTVTVFRDDAEDTLQWQFFGFTLSPDTAHSGSSSFFSGNASNLISNMATKQPIDLHGAGLLSLYMNYRTEDMKDSIIIRFGTGLAETYYGSSNGWINHRIILPPGTEPISIEYRTNASINNGGCYIDDITIQELADSRQLRSGIIDTTIFVFNELKGDYLAAVRPCDAYGNTGDLSVFYPFSINEYASPYSMPNPFQDDCKIILDYPDSLQPSVKIFSISGRLVRHFGNNAIHDRHISWDGMDCNGHPVGAGLYFIVLHDKAFTKVGKIARQT
jgi:hypothetical protein